MSLKKNRIKLRDKYQEYKCTRYCILCGCYHNAMIFHRVVDSISIHNVIRKAYSWNSVLRAILDTTIPVCPDCHSLLHEGDE